MPIYKGDKTKDGRQWYYIVSLTIDGKYKQYKSKRFLTKREAEKEESLFLLQNSETKPKQITFGMVANTYLKQKETTMKPTGFLKLKQQITHVLAVLEDTAVANMTVADYDRLRSYLDERDFSIAYKNKMLITLKSLCKFAQLYYNVSTDIPYKFTRYVDNTTVSHEMNYYTIDEFNQFVSVIDDQRYIAFFTLLFFCGLRCGEANALSWREIDLENKTVQIKKTVTTKLRDGSNNYLILAPKTKSSIRTLPLPNRCVDALKCLYLQWSKCEGFSPDWFVFGGISALPESNIQAAKNRYVKLSGVKNIRVHDFRHSCASLLINSGANITLVSKYLGHSDISMTLNVYSHFYKSKMDELLETLNKF